jgi:hypothetical protein
VLRAKIAGSAKQHEESTAVMKKMAAMVEKIMDENANLRIERERLVRESKADVKRSIEDVKEIIAARRENSIAMDAMTKMAEERRKEVKVVEAMKKELEELRALQQPIKKE